MERVLVDARARRGGWSGAVWLGLLAVVVSVAACGGGGGDDTTATDDPGTSSTEGAASELDPGDPCPFVDVAAVASALGVDQIRNTYSEQPPETSVAPFRRRCTFKVGAQDKVTITVADFPADRASFEFQLADDCKTPPPANITCEPLADLGDEATQYDDHGGNRGYGSTVATRTGTRITRVALNTHDDGGFAQGSHAAAKAIGDLVFPNTRPAPTP